MYTSTLLYLLPLLSLPLSLVNAQAQAEARDESHGHGHFSNSVFNSFGHGHGGPSRRMLHPRGSPGYSAAPISGSANVQRSETGASGPVKKLVRRRKANGKRGKVCKAATSTGLGSDSGEATVTASIPAVANAAKPTTASASASESESDSTSTAAPWESTSSAVVGAWESSATTATSSAAAEGTTSSSGSGSGSGSGTSNLFPWGTGSASWTTSEGGLSFDAALKPLSAGRLPSTRSAPDGSNALVADFPAGTVGLSSAGYSFYTEGSTSGISITSAKEVSFSYSVYLKDGFQFVKGGKMPGLFGGTSFSQAKSCSGGRQDSRDSCFSARLMWRTNGAGEIYDYLPVPYTNTDTGYGESIDRGAYSWATGRWTTVAMRVKLNDVGSANGEQELIVDGNSVISLKDVTFATTEGTKIYGIMAQTFFGGHTDDWASPSDQSIWFKDWSLAVLA